MGGFGKGIVGWQLVKPQYHIKAIMKFIKKMEVFNCLKQQIIKKHLKSKPKPKTTQNSLNLNLKTKPKPKPKTTQNSLNLNLKSKPKPKPKTTPKLPKSKPKN